MHDTRSPIHRRSTSCPLVALLLASCALGCGAPVTMDGAPPAADPALPGPYQVGVTTLKITDPTLATRVFPVEIWYPATPAAGDPFDKPFGIVTRSVRDAAADRRGAPYPVVAFSHGYSGIRYQSIYLTQHLASHGYVVVAPDHLHNTLSDTDTRRLTEVVRNRPRDIQLAIDEILARSALASDPLAGLADATRIGMSGHSFGGYTSLVISGAQLDPDALTAACASMPDNLGCTGFDRAAITAEIIAGFPDPRVKATVALAPGARLAFGASGLGHVGVPFQVQSGTLDTTTPPDSETHPIFEGLPAPRLLADLSGAAHFSFTDICPLYDALGGANGQLAFLDQAGCGANTAPIESVHAASRTLAAAFFELHLRGRADEHGYLDPAHGVAGATLRR